MNSRRRCRDRLIFMLGLSAFLIAISLPLAALAQDTATPVYLHQNVSLDSNGCVNASVSPRLLVAVIDCEGDTVAIGNGIDWFDQQLCLREPRQGCDSLQVVTKLEHRIAFSPYSLRPYLTTTQLASVPEPDTDSCQRNSGIDSQYSRSPGARVSMPMYRIAVGRRWRRG